MLPDGHVGKSLIVFGLRHIIIRKRYLNPWFGTTQGLDDTTLTAEAQYSISFLRSNRKFCLSLYYNGSNSFSFVNATNICQFWNKKYLLCLRNISGDFSVNNMKKTELNRRVYDFSVDYKAFDISNIIETHKYLMKETWCKTMFGLIKRMFFVFLTSLVNASNHTKCLSLSKQKY